MRINKVTCLVGKRGSGKTTYLIKILTELALHHPDRGILIVDMIQNQAYKDIPLMDFDMLDRWTGKGMYRISGENIEEIVALITGKVRNCFVVFEDSTRFILKVLSRNVRKLIVDSKQTNNDIFFVYHGFRLIPPEMFQWIDNLVLFKTKGGPDYRRDDLEDFELINEAWIKVQRHPDQYYKQTITL